MSSIIDELLVLHVIDQKLIALQKRLQAGPEEIKLLESRIAGFRKEWQAIEAGIKSKASNVDSGNLEIRACEEETEEQEEKLRGIKNNKEYKIVTERIKTLKSQIDMYETAALATMEELDVLRVAMKGKQDELDSVEKEMVDLRIEVAKEVEEIKVEARTLKAERDEQLKRLREVNPDACEVYDIALRRGRGSALAEMTDSNCQGCFRKARPNIENIVLAGKDIKECRCSGCGRIMYIKQT